MESKSAARDVLDRLREQIVGRFPKPTYYGQVPEKMKLAELAAVAAVVRDYMAAEREWAAIPDPVPTEHANQ